MQKDLPDSELENLHPFAGIVQAMLIILTNGEEHTYALLFVFGVYKKTIA